MVPCFVNLFLSLSIPCLFPDLIWALDLFRLATASISHHLQARYLFILWPGRELKGSGSATRRLFHALLIPNAVTTISFLLSKEVLFFSPFFNMWPKCSNKEHHSNEDKSQNVTSLRSLLRQRWPSSLKAVNGEMRDTGFFPGSTNRSAKCSHPQMTVRGNGLAFPLRDGPGRGPPVITEGWVL